MAATPPHPDRAGSPTSPSSSETPTPAGSPTADSVCVLWHPPAQAAPVALVESLRRHGAELRFVDNAYSALARVCLAAATDARRPRAVLILLVNPASLREPVAFVRTVRRYAPRSACWWYDDSSSPAFRAVTPEDLARWEAPADVASSSVGGPPNGRQSSDQTRHEERTKGGSMSEAPRLRLTPSEPGEPEPKPVVVVPSRIERPPSLSSAGGPLPPVAPTAPLLTADELAMLLGEGDVSDSPTHPPIPPSPPSIGRP